jgi:hypothetical protein
VATGSGGSNLAGAGAGADAGVGRYGGTPQEESRAVKRSNSTNSNSNSNSNSRATFTEPVVASVANTLRTFLDSPAVRVAHASTPAAGTTHAGASVGFGDGVGVAVRSPPPTYTEVGEWSSSEEDTDDEVTLV